MNEIVNDEVRPAAKVAIIGNRRVWETPTVEVISVREAEADNGAAFDGSSSS